MGVGQRGPIVRILGKWSDKSSPVICMGLVVV